MRATRFIIDTFGNEIFDGFTLGEMWNGWACPHFTLEQAHRVVEAHCAQGGKAWYDEIQDLFAFGFREDEVDAFPAEMVEGRKLYPVGAGCWIWEEAVEEAA